MKNCCCCLFYVSEYSASFKTLKPETPTISILIYVTGVDPPPPFTDMSVKVIFYALPQISLNLYIRYPVLLLGRAIF